MACENQWTVRFPDTTGATGIPFEIRPDTMTLKTERRKYAFCRLKCDPVVGEAMKPHTRYADGELRHGQAAEVLIDGELVSVLYFRPDFVTYGDDYTFIELHDLQESLDSGVIDKKWPRVQLEQAYRHVFEGRKNKLLRDIKFSVPEEVETELIGEREFRDGIRQQDGSFGQTSLAERKRMVEAYEASQTKRLTSSWYALDLDKLSPMEAIWKLNDKFGVESWVDSEYTLWIGKREAASTRHIVAPDDERVWRYGDVNVTHPRNPIYQVTVNGAWEDDPGVVSGDLIQWFIPDGFEDVDGDGDAADGDGGRGFGDVRATGVARATDVDPIMGRAINVDAKDAKRDALGVLAANILREEMKNQHSGTVEINPHLSGDFTRIPDLTVGDQLHVVPDDEGFINPTATSGRITDDPVYDDDSCRSNVNNEIYLVSGVEHRVNDDGSWQVHADVVMFPDNPIESYIMYFDPASEEFYEAEDVFNGGVFEEY